MATEVITLTPAVGDPLTIGGNILLDMEPDWGEVPEETALATGPDVIGGVPGVRTRGVRTITLPLQCRADTGLDYLAAVNSLNLAASNLALKGGTITRAVTFDDDTTSEALETSVLECSLDWDEGWMQAHKRFCRVALNMVVQPYWLAEEEELASATASTDDVIELDISSPRGNLPGPARVVLEDNASTARRFVEIGGQFYEDVASTYVWNASDFTLTGTSGASGADANALGGTAISVTGLVGIWQTMALLEDLPLTGTYRARIRALGGSDSASAVFRVVWRPAGGSWEEAGSVTANVTEYWDFDMGPLRNYSGADTIDVRVDVRGTDTDASSNPKLDTLTLFPAEFYAVARGVPVEGIVAGISILDDFRHDYGSALGTTTSTIGAGTWAESGDATPDWTITLVPPTGGSNTVARAITAADSDMNSGQFQTIGSSGLTDTTVNIESITVRNTATTTGKETRGGIVARYSGTDKWLMFVVRLKRQAHGTLKELALYKCVTGPTVTKIGVLPLTFTSGGTNWTFLDLSLSITAAGVATISCGEDSKTFAVDSALATSGALDDGKVGIYAAADHANNAAVTVSGFSMSANAPTIDNIDVIRSGGLGEMTSVGAWSTETDSTDPIPVSVYEGKRLWIPPSTGRLLIKPRSSDSDAEADTGAGLSTDVTVYSQACFATLSDHDSLGEGGELFPAVLL